MTKRFFLIFLLFIVACVNEKQKLQEKEEIKKMFEKYYKFLSLAYSKDDASILWPVASEHEIAQTKRTMSSMWGEGYHIDPILREFEITYLDIYQLNNAYAKTKEVWAISFYDYKTREKKEDNPSQILHVIYQLKKIDGIWKVTSRVPEETMIKVVQ